jgi:hypothetical protein
LPDGARTQTASTRIGAITAQMGAQRQIFHSFEARQKIFPYWSAIDLTIRRPEPLNNRLSIS